MTLRVFAKRCKKMFLLPLLVSGPNSFYLTNYSFRITLNVHFCGELYQVIHWALTTCIS